MLNSNKTFSQVPISCFVTIFHSYKCLLTQLGIEIEHLRRCCDSVKMLLDVVSLQTQTRPEVKHFKGAITKESKAHMS